MARSVGRGRTIEQKQPVPKYKLPPQIEPQDLEYFHPPKGIDVVTPLAHLGRESSPYISNLVLDRGVMRSRYGLEAYHNNDSGHAIQWTTDIRGSAQNSVTITNRTTAAQSNNGWSGNSNTVTGGPGFTYVPDASKIYCIVGDPAAGNNVDAYDDQYTISFSVQVDHGTVPNGSTASAEVDIEYSTDGGTNWTNLGGGASHGATRTTAGTTTNSYSETVTVSGSPTQLRFRLRLYVLVQAGSGSATGTATRIGSVTWATTSGNISTPDRLPTRWTEAKLQIYEDATDVAGPWTDRYTFPASQLNTDKLLPSYVIWNSTIISTDIGDTPQAGAGTRMGSKGLISTVLAAGHATSILTHSPRAAQLFILGNRVVAVRTNEWTALTDPWTDGGATNLSRVRWCVKNNSNDWDGIGSGFEDMLVPKGSVDEAMAGVPVTDETAVVVSEHTIRRMDVTGFVDAPFRFTLLDESLGTLSRYTVQGIPGGAIFLGYDDVYKVTLAGIERIGTLALRDSLAQITNPRLATGYMDHYNARYVVAFKEGTTQVVWSYSFFDQGWTRLALPFDVVAIDLAFYDILGTTFFGSYFTQKITSGYSVRENKTLSTDVDTTPSVVDSGLEARTGFITLDPLRKVSVVQIQLLYESNATQDLTFEYSKDGGVTWLQYSSTTINATTRPTVVRMAKFIEAEVIQVRLRTTVLGQLKVISLHVFAAPGGYIRP